jgi:serine/threonine protein kinase
MLLGTPGYIAPELYRGLKADHRVDIYALGALMHKLLTGELPPMGGSDEGEPMRGLPAPDAVSTVLGKALRENPDQRWTTAQELAQALRADPSPVHQRRADPPPAAHRRRLHRPSASRPAPAQRAAAKRQRPPCRPASRRPCPPSRRSSAVERDGSARPPVARHPALLMLLALDRRPRLLPDPPRPRDAPVAQDMSKRPALAGRRPAAAAPPLPLPRDPASSPNSAPRSRRSRRRAHPTPVARPSPVTPPVADPPVNQPPVEPGPLQTPSS